MSRIKIVGAGVVGAATGKGLSHFGHHVVFSDVRPEVLRKLSREGYVVHPNGVADGAADITMLCVGTPTVDGATDLGHLESACRGLAAALRESDGYHLVVVRCTVPPGTTAEFVIPRLEEWSGRTAGRDFGVCHNPEFLREASAFRDFIEPWIIVIGGYDSRSAQALRKLYGPISHETGAAIVETELHTSEMVKYASNLFNASKISFTNEIWSACRELGIDGDEVMSAVAQAAEGMWNPKYGTRGGFPYGGTCLPKDTTAFLTFARERGIDMSLLEVVMKLNDEMARRQPKEADRPAPKWSHPRLVPLTKKDGHIELERWTRKAQ